MRELLYATVVVVTYDLVIKVLSLVLTGPGECPAKELLNE
jgi:hypothetical protein